MTKQEMWDLINKENAIKEENEANIVAAEKKISDLQSKIDVAIRKKDSAAAIKFSDQLEAERRKLEIYRNIVNSYQYGVDISKEDFMKCFATDITTPFYKRSEELRTELTAKREEYIVLMKSAYKELNELSCNAHEFMDLACKGKLDINVNYPNVDMRNYFINENRYFFED
ncbi:hypothetical protein [Cellulosilyticum sp. WCF-2]|uniref:hypothetical protein n=1 Tax=Cellulosilyticum sp. WCF-2 TaxID=2497860 RepID=UPI000F8F31DB|nr:hypothetical protein [Cellulosilyticum sp. WCF-2]QEH70507.1 hypothetical protein EKH84_19715 [Cellulosilyticum sp. WCF-2]